VIMRQMRKLNDLYKEIIVRIMITGANGFLGHRLVEYFSKKGHEVIAISRSNTRGFSENVMFVQMDLSDPKSKEVIVEVIDKYGAPDIVFHSAALKPGDYTFNQYYQSNVTALLFFLQGISRVKVKRFVYFSTTSVFCPSDNSFIKEEYPVCWDNYYTATKIMGEIISKHQTNAESVTILRIPSLYGVGQNDSFVDGLLEQIKSQSRVELWDNGSRIRDALHVSDIVHLCRILLHIEDPLPFIVNIGPPKSYTTFDYAKELVTAFNIGCEIKTVNKKGRMVSDLHVDSSLAKKALGFQAKDLAESMRIYAQEIENA
jgi:UDP-glucose 4-epimerase